MKNMKTTFYLTLLVLFGAALMARGETQQVTVAVLTMAGVQRTLAKNVTALLAANLSTEERLNIVDRNELDQVAVTVSLKVQERQAGRILVLDLERSTAGAIGEQITVQQAFQNALDDWPSVVIPALAQLKTQP